MTPESETPPFKQRIVAEIQEELNKNLEPPTVVWRNGVAVQIVDNTQTASNGVVR